MDHEDNYKEIIERVENIVNLLKDDEIPSAMFELGVLSSAMNLILMKLDHQPCCERPDSIQNDRRDAIDVLKEMQKLTELMKNLRERKE